MSHGKPEHKTSQLRMKPGKRANQQAHVATAVAAPKGRPQHANDNPRRSKPS